MIRKRTWEERKSERQDLGKAKWLERFTESYSGRNKTGLQ